MAAPTQRQAYLLLVAVMVAWGVNWPFMKVGLQYIPPLWFATTRVLLGCACLFGLLAAQGRIHLPARRDIPVLVSVGAVQVALCLGLIHVGLQYVDAGRSVILAYTMPLWVTPMAMVVLGERLDGAKAGGLVLGLGGVAVLFNPLSFDFTDRQGLIGNGLLLGCALSWGAVIVHVRGRRWQTPPLELMPWQLLLAGVLLGAAAGWLEGDRTVHWTGTLVLVLAYNGPVGSAFCFWAYVTVARSLPATSTALGSLGVPVVGMLASAAFLGEPPSAANAGGLALISAGVALVTIADVGRGRTA